MKTLYKHFLTLFICFLLCLGASAQITWTAGAGTTYWSDPGNWDAGSVPGPGDDVYIPAWAIVDMDVNAEIDNLYMDWYSTLNMGTEKFIINSDIYLESGSVLNATNDTLVIPYYNNDGYIYMGTGTLFVTSGDAAGGWNVYVGNATVILNGTSGIQNIGLINIGNLIINNTDGAQMNNNLNIYGDLNGVGTLYSNGSWLYIQGNVNLQSFDPSNSNVYLYGASVQYINCPSFYNLICANDSGIVLTGNTVVNNQLAFDPTAIISYSGPSCLHLNGYELQMASGTGISGYGVNNGFIVCENGQFIMENDNSGEVYPIGTSEDVYTPVIINSSNIVSYNVIINSGVTDQNLAAVTSRVLNATWKITPNTDAIAFVAYCLYDTSKLELSGFDRNNFNLYTRNDQSTPTAWTLVSSGNSAMHWSGETFSPIIGPMTLTSGDHYFSAADPNAALPVELISFTARPDNGKNILDWKTASEINNDHFEIQRSVDAKNWSAIGDVPGHGTTQQEEVYSYIDASANTLSGNVVYYRLKQVDYNGAFVYSDIRKINITNTNAGLKLYPNPATDFLTLFSADGTERAVRIFDMNGQCIYSNIQSGYQNKIDISAFNSGMYILKTCTNNDVSSQVFCKE